MRFSNFIVIHSFPNISPSYALWCRTTSMDSYVCRYVSVSSTETHTNPYPRQDKHTFQYVCGCGMSNDCLQPEHFSISAVEHLSISALATRSNVLTQTVVRSFWRLCT